MAIVDSLDKIGILVPYRAEKIVSGGKTGERMASKRKEVMTVPDNKGVGDRVPIMHTDTGNNLIFMGDIGGKAGCDLPCDGFCQVRVGEFGEGVGRDVGHCPGGLVEQGWAAGG